MQSRRWWYSVAAVAVLAAGSIALGAPPKAAAIKTAAGIPKWVKDKVGEIATAKTDKDARQGAVDLSDEATNPDHDILFINSFADALATEAGAQILDKPGASQLATVTIAQSISDFQVLRVTKTMPPVVSALADRLKHPNAAVRYWAAKGMVTVFPTYNAADKAKAITALKAALKIETSAPARTQMEKVLGIAGEAGAIIEKLDNVSPAIRSKPLVGVQGDGMAQELDALADAIGKARATGTFKPADETAAVKVAANIASYMAQHAAAADAANPKDPNAPAILTAAVTIGNAALNVINKAENAITYNPVAGPAVKLWFDIESATDPKSATAVQRKYPTILYPPRIGDAAAPSPATTAATSGAGGATPR
jgi:hypothetical protein